MKTSTMKMFNRGRILYNQRVAISQETVTDKKLPLMTVGGTTMKPVKPHWMAVGHPKDDIAVVLSLIKECCTRSIRINNSSGTNIFLRNRCLPCSSTIVSIYLSLESSFFISWFCSVYLFHSLSVLFLLSIIYDTRK